MNILAVKKSLKDLLIESIEQGNHTLRDFGTLRQFDEYSTGEIIKELEILEGIHIYKVEPPQAPFISWWLKKPKGKVVYDENGKLKEVAREPKRKPLIPIQVRIVEPETEFENAGEFVQIPIGKLIPNPLNPRTSVNVSEQKFVDLVESIKAHGIQQPLVVTEQNRSFRIIIGHRRFEAAKSAGLENVPCVIREFEEGDEESVMLIENIQRKDLTPIQEGKAFKRRFTALGKDINAVARELGLTQSYIKQRMALLKLNPDIQQMVDDRKIGFSQALQLTRLESFQQNRFVAKAVKHKASVLKELIDREKSGAIPPPRWKNDKRVTDDSEVFNRSWALKALSDLGSDAYLTVGQLRDSFNDICQENCDESVCRECPAPRMIAAITRLYKRGDGNA